MELDSVEDNGLSLEKLHVKTSVQTVSKTKNHPTILGVKVVAVLKQHCKFYTTWMDIQSML